MLTFLIFYEIMGYNFLGQGDKKNMFGILEKMDRFSNKLMSREEKIDFMQEIVDTGIVWDMHQKYIDEAVALMSQGVVFNMVLRRKVDNNAPRQEVDAGGYNPFDTSLCG